MTNKQREIIENLGWSIDTCTFSNDKPGYTFQQYSPAGEDFSISVLDADDLTAMVMTEYLDFDPDEHVEMWIEARKNGVCGIPSAIELVEDAIAIERMLRELVDALNNGERI